MKNKKFTTDDFSFICPMQWDDMEKVTDGRFCDKCEQLVVDVSDCSLDEVALMQREDPAICVSIKTIATVATSGVVLSLAACSSQPPAPVVRLAGAPRHIPHNAQQTDKLKKTAEQQKRQALSSKLFKSKTHCQLPETKKR